MARTLPSGAAASAIGLDFGTTNTVATHRDGAGVAAYRIGAQAAFRSVLAFWKEDDAAAARVEAGLGAIEVFLERQGDCRFIQSFKTFAASPQFTDTTVYGRRLAFEDLLQAFLLRYRAHAGATFAERVAVGRPVAFAGANPDEALARQRYEAALRAVGFCDIHHVYEPVAAAFYFAQRLTRPATILVADFGGGTSDFSLVRFQPQADGIQFEPLGHAGVGVAGDAFDFRIIDHVVSPRLGKGSSYRSFDKVLPVPNAFYTRFGRWNQLSLMRATRDFADLKKLAPAAAEPDKIEAFIALIEAEAGFALYQAVSGAKMRLSQVEATDLTLAVGGLRLEAQIARADFESWIAPDLARIEATLEAALANCAITEDGVDKVFLTGGASFVPAVRALFHRRFAPDRIETGDQLVSIAYGLGLIAGEPDLARWSV